MDNSVCVDVEAHFDLGHAAWSWWNSVESESSEGFVIFCELSFPLYDVDIDCSLVVVGGKALGPISTLLALVDFFEAYDEYAGMKLMLDRMLERVEIVAYLDVLIKKYDGLISAHDQIIDELIKTYSIYSKSECR